MSDNGESDQLKGARFIRIHLTEIIQGYFDDSSLSGEQKPKLIIIAGGPGSGKTTIRKKEYSDGYVLIDAGDIFKKICEGDDIDYDFGKDFSIETEAAGNAVANRAIREKRNIVIEIIGSDNYEGIKEVMDAVLGYGYEVEFKLITCDDLAEAYRRHVQGAAEFLSAAFTESYQMRWLKEAAENEGYEEEPEKVPKTIKEAVEKFIEQWDRDEIEWIMDCKEESGLGFLYEHIGDSVISRCGLDDGNIELLEACGSRDMKPKDAARVIVGALWRSIRH